MADAPLQTSVVNGVRTNTYNVTVPVDHSKDNGPSEMLRIFVREVILEKDAATANKKEALLWLQGGPGFPATRPTFPLSGWMDAASKKGFRIFLLDQRGTGMSSPITPASLQRRFSNLSSPAGAQAAASFLTHFRADSIVHDCEVVRKNILGPEAKFTLLGQSFGGFCILSYLSLFPDSIERCLFTCGLAPVLQPPDEVYTATFRRLATRNRRYYERYPGDVVLVRDIASYIRDQGPIALPSGGLLTLRRFLMTGLELGSAGGLEELHFIMEGAWSEASGEPGDQRYLSAQFLNAMDRIFDFETNPIFWMLHEAIYCNGPGISSQWAASRVKSTLELTGAPYNLFNADNAGGSSGKPHLEESSLPLEDQQTPIYFSGEMVYPWMGDGDFAALAPLRGVAEILAQKNDWPELYDIEGLRGVSNKVPCAALISYDDMYVEREFSEQTAELMNCKVWITNEFQHGGIRDEGARVFNTVLGIANGEIAIPS